MLINFKQRDFPHLILLKACKKFSRNNGNFIKFSLQNKLLWSRQNIRALINLERNYLLSCYLATIFWCRLEKSDFFSQSTGEKTTFPRSPRKSKKRLNTSLLRVGQFPYIPSANDQWRLVTFQQLLCPERILDTLKIVFSHQVTLPTTKMQKQRPS